jgi:hypothetical protein
MPSDGKSSHCLWQGELKKNDLQKEKVSSFHSVWPTNMAAKSNSCF